jgi:pantoate kinase
MVVISDGDNILLKKVEAPKPEDFKKLLKNSREYAQSVGLKKSDLKNGLKEVRARK